MEARFSTSSRVIALETAVGGVPLSQVRFFATGWEAPDRSDVAPRFRVLLLMVLSATIFGSLQAIREGWGRWSAALVTVGLAVSLPADRAARAATAATRRANPAAPSARLDHRARSHPLRGVRPADRLPPVGWNLPATETSRPAGCRAA